MKTDNELHEGNILIAKFMGHSVDNYYRYDAYWDCLMPVVEKIGNIELPNGQYGKHVDFTISSHDGIGWIFWTKNVPGDQNQPQSYPIDGTMIERSYKAVVEFIKWYKQQQP